MISQALERAMRSPITGITATFLAMTVPGACSSAARGGTPAPAASNISHESRPSHVAQARADSLRYPYTAADIRFMSRMIGHHAQAIVISRWAPTHGASASVRTLAARIINAQEDEIATMQQWLRDRLQPVPHVHSAGMKMEMNGVEHVMAMPGMLTEVELKQLEAARGRAFDRLFLSLMIRHHRGAVAMVKDLFESYGAAQDETVFRLASDVNVDQSTEIERMEKMLAALPQKPEP